MGYATTALGDRLASISDIYEYDLDGKEKEEFIDSLDEFITKWEMRVEEMENERASEDAV